MIGFFLKLDDRIDSFDPKKMIIISIVIFIVNLLFVQFIFDFFNKKYWYLGMMYLIIMMFGGIYGLAYMFTPLQIDTRQRDRRFKTGYKDNNNIRTYHSLKTVINRFFFGLALSSLVCVEDLPLLVIPIVISIGIIGFCINFYLFKKGKVDWKKKKYDI